VKLTLLMLARNTSFEKTHFELRVCVCVCVCVKLCHALTHEYRQLLYGRVFHQVYIYIYIYIYSSPPLLVSSTLFRFMTSPCGVSRSHSLDTPHLVGLLWTSDRSEAVTTYNMQKSQETIIHAAGGIRSHIRQVSGRRPTPCTGSILVVKQGSNKYAV